MRFIGCIIGGTLAQAVSLLAMDATSAEGYISFFLGCLWANALLKD